MNKKMKFLHLFSLPILAVFYMHSIYAAENASIELFSSNNDHEISLQQAFVRLTGEPQTKLQTDIIKIMQQNKIEQGTFESVLGTYQMSTDKNITADNTEIFYTSPYQLISDKKIFYLAAELAKTFNQDSVAVFIPSKTAPVSEIKIHFEKNKPSIEETIAVIKKYLPPSYSQAFSLKLDSGCGDFKSVSVKSVEWMSSHLNTQLVQKAFPQQTITTQKGSAYLVYKTGKTSPL